MDRRDRAALLDVLEDARERGFLGPGPVERQLEHAADLAAAIGDFRGELLDLGSGGGLPGLVLLHEWNDARAALLDAQQRRCEFVDRAIRALGLSSRATVECGRAEELARDAGLREHFDLVVARSFGPPAVTAECAVGFLHAGGALVVTEPPSEDDMSARWDRAGLGQLGFGAPIALRVGETGAVRLELDRPPDGRWPRRNGIPAKRPLF